MPVPLILCDANSSCVDHVLLLRPALPSSSVKPARRSVDTQLKTPAFPENGDFGNYGLETSENTDFRGVGGVSPHISTSSFVPNRNDFAEIAKMGIDLTQVTTICSV
jgi:hypothetical protein